MKRLLAITMVAVIALGAGQAFAGANPEINMAIDVQLKFSKRACTPAYASCSGIQQVYGGSGYLDCIVVAYRYDSIAGIEYGVDWTGAGYFSGFISCADFIIGGTDLGGWTSIAQTWSACQYATAPAPATSGIGVGWVKFYAYEPQAFNLVLSVDGFLQALDCSGLLDPIHTVHHGYCGGMTPDPADYPPCTMGPTATESATWGGVKSLYQ